MHDERWVKGELAGERAEFNLGFCGVRLQPDCAKVRLKADSTRE
jgi:hypothetical protein